MLLSDYYETYTDYIKHENEEICYEFFHFNGSLIYILLLAGFPHVAYLYMELLLAVWLRMQLSLTGNNSELPDRHAFSTHCQDLLCVRSSIYIVK